MENKPQGTAASLQPQKFTLSDITDSVAKGFEFYLSIPGASTVYAIPFAIIGLVILSTIGLLGMSPMLLPFAGGFMLVGPAMLTGFFSLSASEGRHKKPDPMDAFSAFRQAPAGLWVIALLCTFLFLVWITDAAVLYSMMIGGAELPYQLPGIINLEHDQVIPFELWGSLMGSIIAFIIFAISAFSVPLLHYGRGNLVQSIHASVRAVLRNFFNSIAWGIILTVAIVLSIVLLPLFLVVLPVLAYASHNLYLKVFPLSHS